MLQLEDQTPGEVAKPVREAATLADLETEKKRKKARKEERRCKTEQERGKLD